MAINFFEEETTFRLDKRQKRKKWLKSIARESQGIVGVCFNFLQEFVKDLNDAIS